MKKTSVRSAKIGKGTFSEEKILAGETIYCFFGELVSYSAMIDGVKSQLFHIDDPLQVDDELFLICDESTYFVNHSCEPNCGVSGFNKLIAIEDIEPGDEISMDYGTVTGTSPMDHLWEMNCDCGSQRCRGVIGSISLIPRERVEYYLQRGGLPNFIIKQLIASRTGSYWSKAGGVKYT